MNERIKVFIVDDYAVVRHGLLALLDTAPDMIVVGEAGDGITAVQKALDLRPDVIVMDLVMPGMDGLQTIEALKKAGLQARILVLTNICEPQRVLAVLRAGARGYLLKDAVLTDIVEAIRDVYSGKITLHPSIAHIVMQAMQDPNKKKETAVSATVQTAVSTAVSLTEREQDVLKFVAKGLTNQDIAQSLHINERTVCIHVSHILLKLNLENRTQAALYALRHNLASLND